MITSTTELSAVCAVMDEDAAKAAAKIRAHAEAHWARLQQAEENARLRADESRRLLIEAGYRIGLEQWTTPMRTLLVAPVRDPAGNVIAHHNVGEIWA